MELGIYIHIPFCVKKCDYCDFLSMPAPEDVRQAYMEQLMKELELLEPFGKGNPKPVFADKNIHILSIGIFGKSRNVCRMQVQSQAGTVMSAVYFGQVEEFLDFLGKKYGSDALAQAMSGKGGGMQASFIYYPEINVYNGRESLQIIVKNYC